MRAPWLVVVPAYNEAPTLPGLIAEARYVLGDTPIVVVDDGSSDATPDLLPALSVHWLRFAARVGTGTAVRAGIRYGLERGLDTVVRLDGDGQHPPGEIPGVLDPIERGAADAVQGTRYGDATGYRASGVRRLGQRVLGTALSVATSRRVSDPTSGFWAFGPRATRVLARLHPSGYPEPELLLLLHAHRLRVAEVGVRMRPRVAGRSSLTGPRLGVIAVRVVLGAALARVRPAPGASPS